MSLLLGDNSLSRQEVAMGVGSRYSRVGRWARAGTVLVVLAVSLIAVTPFAAAGNNPIFANNGTVKVDRNDFDDHPDNEPHVGCVFQIDFYGYEEGDVDALVTFEAQPPTGKGILLTDTVFIGEDPAGGGTDLDASETYDISAALAGYTPHPQQGFHVKLTVNAEGSKGADGKHKVFWVEGCDTSPTTTTTTAPPTTSTTAPPTTTSSTTSTTSPPSTTTSSTTSTTRPPASTTTRPPASTTSTTGGST
jgi:hypothetical protein